MKFFISSHQHRLLISDSMSTFQTNAGNIILTLSKLHIRAIHHALSEIGTKRWFSYQGFAIKRNYRGQKLLVESNRKHGFDLKTFISISNYSSSLRRYRGHYLVPLLSRQIQFDGGGTSVSTIGAGGDTTIPSPGRSPKQPLPGIGLRHPHMVGKLAPNSTYFTRGLVKYIPGRGCFRAVPSQNGDKIVTSPPPLNR